LCATERECVCVCGRERGETWICAYRAIDAFIFTQLPLALSLSLPLALSLSRSLSLSHTHTGVLCVRVCVRVCVCVSLSVCLPRLSLCECVCGPSCSDHASTHRSPSPFLPSSPLLPYPLSSSPSMSSLVLSRISREPGGRPRQGSSSLRHGASSRIELPDLPRERMGSSKQRERQRGGVCVWVEGRGTRRGMRIIHSYMHVGACLSTCVCVRVCVRVCVLARTDNYRVSTASPRHTDQPGECPVCVHSHTERQHHLCLSGFSQSSVCTSGLMCMYVCMYVSVCMYVCMYMYVRLCCVLLRSPQGGLRLENMGVRASRSWVKMKASMARYAHIHVSPLSLPHTHTHSLSVAHKHIHTHTCTLPLSPFHFLFVQTSTAEDLEDEEGSRVRLPTIAADDEYCVVQVPCACVCIVCVWGWGGCVCVCVCVYVYVCVCGYVCVFVWFVHLCYIYLWVRI